MFRKVEQKSRYFLIVLKNRQSSVYSLDFISLDFSDFMGKICSNFLDIVFFLMKSF